MLKIDNDRNEFTYNCKEEFSFKDLGLSYSELKKLVTILSLPSPYRLNTDETISYLIQEYLFVGGKANTIDQVSQ